MSNKISCRFVKLDPGAKVPKVGEEKSLGMDIYSLEPFWISGKEVKIIGTGLIAIPPPGFHYEILLRSSTPKRYPGLILANHVGLIDPSYCGPEDEIKLALLNTSPNDHYVTLDKPIAQLILRENIFGSPKELTWKEYERTGFVEKSRGGFGSTDSNEEEKG